MEFGSVFLLLSFFLRLFPSASSASCRFFFVNLFLWESVFNMCCKMMKTESHCTNHFHSIFTVQVSIEVFVCTDDCEQQSTEQSIDIRMHAWKEYTHKYVPKMSLETVSSLLLFMHMLCARLTLQQALDSKETKYPQNYEIVFVAWVSRQNWNHPIKIIKITSNFNWYGVCQLYTIHKYNSERRIIKSIFF